MHAHSKHARADGDVVESHGRPPLHWLHDAVDGDTQLAAELCEESLLQRRARLEERHRRGVLDGEVRLRGRLEAERQRALEN